MKFLASPKLYLLFVYWSNKIATLIKNIYGQVWLTLLCVYAEDKTIPQASPVHASFAEGSEEVAAPRQSWVHQERSWIAGRSPENPLKHMLPLFLLSPKGL